LYRLKSSQKHQKERNQSQLILTKLIDQRKLIIINKLETNEFLLIRDATQLIMKAVMHELDYDMDDADLKFLNELNKTKRIKILSVTFFNFLF
jgi:hypothetical protein